MGSRFIPAKTGNAPMFIMLAGGTNTGKSWSMLRLARGLVGPSGRIAAVDTEGGRLSSLAKHHRFDINYMKPPFTPTRFAELAEEAEIDGYGAFMIDSASMMHVGPGGYRDWHEQEVLKLITRDGQVDESRRKAMDWPARRYPSLDRQAMFYSLLQRRIPILFSCRARLMTEKVGNAVKPIGWQPVIHDELIWDVTVSFTLRPEDGQGIINYDKPCKVEQDHRAIFIDKEQFDEHHGAALAELSRREEMVATYEAIRSDGKRVGFATLEAWAAWWDRPIVAAGADALKALRAANGSLIAEYAGQQPELIAALEHRLDEAIQPGRSAVTQSTEEREAA